MRIILAATDPTLAEAWERFCGDVDDVSIYRGSVLDVSCDAAVSPTDVFGFMTYGVNFGYTARFGPHVQETLQRLIRCWHHGQLPVGSAEIVPTENASIPFLIAAPIARMPGILRGTANPYLAARAALLLIREGVFKKGEFEGRRVASMVTSVAFTGLGTGGAQVPAAVCARQVRAAIDEIVFGKVSFPSSPTEALAREDALHKD